ncbi:kinase suppressor of Ras 1-like isoform X2 [Clytia hemisphaerica]|uniref:kinase suppressor of Ras 1-like isoform X2 n=1 Tax=Clytia hemisphaerica TaxID=252671 RepID=UPI0034D617ED
MEEEVATLEMLQKVVDMKIQHLKGVRDKQHHEARSEIITSEISDLEGKLMVLFASQIKSKSKIVNQEHAARFYPKLSQFLYVVDIDEEMRETLVNRCSLVEELFEFSNERLAGIFYVHDDDEMKKKKLDGQYKRLRAARNIVKDYVVRLQNGEKRSELPWNSQWHEMAPDSPASVRSSIASVGHLSVFNYGPNEDLSNFKSRSIPPSPSPARSVSSIPRSRSDDANVGQRIHRGSTSSAGSSSSTSRYMVKSEKIRRKNKPGIITIPPSTDGETDSDHSKSRSSSITSSQSPRTPTLPSNSNMGHSIKHRFSGKQLLISIACDYCTRVMLFGLKCKHCGFKCHKKCSRKVPPSCSLPPQMLDYFKKKVDNESRAQVDGLVPIKRTNSEPSNFANRVRSIDKHMSSSHGSLMHNTVGNGASSSMVGAGSHRGASADTYSTASSTSSISSSTFHSDSPLGTPGVGGDGHEMGNNERFPFFPDGDNLVGEISLVNSLISTTSTVSEASTNTLIDSKCSSDTKSSSTLSIQEEENSVDDLDDQISDIRKHVKLRHESLSKGEKHDRMMIMHNHGSLMSEWVIPFSQIEIGDHIGVGRVGKVYKAKWHGECALKVLYLENPTTEEKNDFKYKVQVLRRTRHENLVLFMGACMEPATLAIVCSFIKGMSLYSHIHVHETKFDDVKIISIVQQIAQGMSYLHARKIVHKDLKTKNVFLEHNQNRIVITDFGLISIADVKVTNTRKNHLMLPKGWLCYQAPEIIRHLSAHDPGCEVLYYTRESDIYAFGTIWFELLAGDWPFAKQSNQSIIWQIGKGVKQSLSDPKLTREGLYVTRETKDIISMTWALDPENRPQFSALLKAFERLPKKRLIRSPSQPTYLTRTANALLI